MVGCHGNQPFTIYKTKSIDHNTLFQKVPIFLPPKTICSVLLYLWLGVPPKIVLPLRKAAHPLVPTHQTSHRITFRPPLDRLTPPGHPQLPQTGAWMAISCNSPFLFTLLTNTCTQTLPNPESTLNTTCPTPQLGGKLYLAT